MSEEKLKKVVQKAVTDDNRSKNVMVFGLSEEKTEDLDCKITALFGESEEKPGLRQLELELIPLTRAGQSQSLSETVHRLLINKAKKLKTTTTYKRVYISPDRSPEEREKHRLLVAEMRRQAEEDPDSHYYLCCGYICCRDKD